MGEEGKINQLKRISTLGGPIRIKKEMSWVYGLDSTNPNLSKEKLFGAVGPLHPGMPYNQRVAIEATQSDTRATLVKELTEQSGLTKKEAESTVDELIRKGLLEEIDDPNLGKVLVFRDTR